VEIVVKYLFAFILILLLLILAGIVQSATQIQRAVIGDKVYVVYFLATDHQPVVTAGNDYITSRSIIQDGQQWRLTINATLPLCTGELAVDGQRVTKQQCVYMPEVAR